MQLHYRYRYSLLVLLSFCILSLFYIRSKISTSHVPHETWPTVPEPEPLEDDTIPAELIQHHYPSSPPRIQLIAIWSPGNKPPIYFPNFFASVAANPSIDLLLVKYNRYNRSYDECTSLRAAGIPNVREICLSTDEFHDLHLDFFCGRWSCNEDERKQVRAKMLKRAERDRVNSHYRPYRAAVFQKYLHPETKLWGWCDLDLMFGNFDRAFPWDITEHFDVYISGWPSNSDVLMFMPGHLTVFRYSQHVLDEFMLFPNLRDIQSYLAEPWIDDASEESIYSYFVFWQSGLTFVRFDAMVQADYHVTSPALGTYEIQDIWKLNRSDSSPLHVKEVVMQRRVVNVLLKNHHLEPPNETAWRSYTQHGREHTVQLKLGEYTGVLWFPKNISTHYDTDWSGDFFREKARRLIYRREARGEVKERLEPWKNLILPPVGTSLDADTSAQTTANTDGALLVERLYDHLQHEKYTKWWSMPHLPFKRGDILLIHKNEGGLLWDEQGRIRWKSPNWEGEGSYH